MVCGVLNVTGMGLQIENLSFRVLVVFDFIHGVHLQNEYSCENWFINTNFILLHMTLT